MKWHASRTQETTAAREAIWDRWTIPEHWSADDPEVRWARFDVPVTVGVVGTLKAAGPAQRLIFTEVVHLEAMTFEIRLPGARMSLPHRMAAGRQPGTTAVTHGVLFTGPLARIYGALIGRRMVRRLSDVIRLANEHAVLTTN